LSQKITEQYRSRCRKTQISGFSTIEPVTLICPEHDMRNAATNQVDVLTALSKPTTHGGEAVRRIDTHASIIFLVGTRAIKVKRAVRFPFLDYSTLERRKAACEAEIEINRPCAPQIYRGVVAITSETDGSLQIGGKGTPVEWAVDMRRFDENSTLDKLADRRLIDLNLSEDLARAVLAAHARAPVIEVEPWLAAFRSFIDQNDAAFLSNPRLFPLAETEALTALSLEAYTRVRPLLLRRGAAGFVKRLHGDLHLGNIVVLNDHPVLFDAIEFDPLVSAGDVLYDLAFLIMDLTERGLRPAANIVLNRYLQESGELSHFDALIAFPLFISMRAAIRAKVTDARCNDASPADRPSIEMSAVRYFKFALEFLKPPPPTLLAVGGLSGTGKTVLARAIAPVLNPMPGAVVLRSDVERKQLFEVNETEPLPKKAYSTAVTKRVYSSLAQKAERIISAGQSAIIDAVFADVSERAEIASIATNRQTAFRGLFLTADLETRLSRVSMRFGDASDADQTVLLQQSQYDLGTLDWSIIDASGSKEQTLTAAQRLLPINFEQFSFAPFISNDS
jgi:uncharacterized protein